MRGENAGEISGKYFENAREQPAKPRHPPPNKKGAPGAPFCSCVRSAASALGELERPAGLGAAVFLALDHARVAGEEAATLQDAAQIGLKLGERLGDRVAHGARL